MASLCGVDCSQCEWGCSCKGCEATGGKPFGGSCVLAEQCRKGLAAWEAWRASLLQAFNDLRIPDMGPVTSLEALAGSYINLEYTLPGGQKNSGMTTGSIWAISSISQAASAAMALPPMKPT